MSARIEAANSWVLGELDDWSIDSGVEKKLAPGSLTHVGFQRDITSVSIRADKRSTLVTVYPGFKPLHVETSGIVSAIPLTDPRSKIMEFELKGVDAIVQITQSEEVLIVRNS